MVEQTDADYLRGGARPLTTESSLLISSSKYLNSPALRHICAQEMLRKYGSDLPPAYTIPEIIAAFDSVTDKTEVLGYFAAERRRNSEFAAWLDARHLSTYDPKTLAECKPDSLGRMVHDFITTSGFDIDFMYRGAPADDYQYWIKRFVQSHDIQHMVAGFDVTPIGEYALTWVNTTNYFDAFAPELAAELSRQTTFSIACGLMRANLHYPKTAPLLAEALTISHTMAKGLRRPLFYVRWEDYMDNSLAEIREDLNLRGAPAPGAWAWAYP